MDLKNLILMTLTYSLVGAFMGAFASMLIEWNSIVGAIITVALVIALVFIAKFLHKAIAEWSMIYIAIIILLSGAGTMLFFTSKS